MSPTVVLFLLCWKESISVLCPYTDFASSPTNTLFGAAQTYPVSMANGWNPITPGQWVWESPGSTTGTFTFHSSFVIPSWALTQVTVATLDISADDWYSVTINGSTVTSWTGNYYTVDSHNVVGYLIGADSTGQPPNVLTIDVENNSGPSGLIYNLHIEY